MLHMVRFWWSEYAVDSVGISMTNADRSRTDALDKHLDDNYLDDENLDNRLQIETFNTAVL